MGARVIVGHEQGSDDEVAVLHCSVTGIAFGPVFSGGADEAREFLRWLGNDPRMYPEKDLMTKYRQFWVLTRDNQGEYVGLGKGAA